jgi:hypothetical protein
MKYQIRCFIGPFQRGFDEELHTYTLSRGIKMLVCECEDDTKAPFVFEHKWQAEEALTQLESEVHAEFQKELNGIVTNSIRTIRDSARMVKNEQ